MLSIRRIPPYSYDMSSQREAARLLRSSGRSSALAGGRGPVLINPLPTQRRTALGLRCVEMLLQKRRNSFLPGAAARLIV